MKKKTVPAILIHMDWIETIKWLSHEQIGAFIIAIYMPTIEQIFPKTIVGENPYTTQPKNLSKNCVKLEERTSLTPRIEILLERFPTFKSFLECHTIVSLSGRSVFLSTDKGTDFPRIVNAFC